VIKTIGRYIIIDTEFSEEKPIFRGTQVVVADVLADVATGMPWELITNKWHPKVTDEAIAEAMRLARKVFLAHADEIVNGAPRTVKKLEP
jgi:uncharacterized protein (DUF433 family)